MLMKNRMLMLVVLLSPVLALAGWFDWGNKAESKPGAASEIRRYVLKIPNKAAEQELIRLSGLKQNLLEEMRVLSHLTEEKKIQLQQFQKGLLGAFSMNPATNYQYDPKAKTIYELIPSASAATTNRTPPGATTVPPAGFDRQLHLQLTTEQQIQQFLRLTAGRKLVQDEVRAFASVIREKQLELEGVAGLLRDKFSISKDRNYEYEPATMRLYEVGVPAASAKTPASGSSAIQLRAVLPQQQVATPAADDLQKPVPLR
jgi:hypothetical protein